MQLMFKCSSEPCVKQNNDMRSQFYFSPVPIAPLTLPKIDLLPALSCSFSFSRIGGLSLAFLMKCRGNNGLPPLGEVVERFAEMFGSLGRVRRSLSDTGAGKAWRTGVSIGAPAVVICRSCEWDADREMAGVLAGVTNKEADVMGIGVDEPIPTPPGGGCHVPSESAK